MALKICFSIHSSAEILIDWNFNVSESWHPRPTPTLANRPVMSSEKVRKEFLGLGHVGWRRFTVSHLDIEIVVQLHLIILSTLPPGYHFGLVKLEVKSKTSSGVEFTAGGNTTTDGGKVIKIFSVLPFCRVYVFKTSKNI